MGVRFGWRFCETDVVLVVMEVVVWMGGRLGALRGGGGGGVNGATRPPLSSSTCCLHLRPLGSPARLVTFPNSLYADAKTIRIHAT